ncbi:bifunctional DNA-formamidopyrimidine glycosylase/DNA-(apurinic or apyrimidinic site) lyase [Psittacicella gerlachiana]|uniref:DNA-formamidopyrimidine glycosylase n=1 Tax=Psittacicella gerlachiana TaxID=2028574 RepID=A0A3A1Y4S2_9GAMM|nr:bifunctional DNA-formamidopyrimidine glycosylase/DNA-(apurinic or apyrimidinic site) lyase [Psittacicella gerlachiana]RIY32218.1 DNA-formamidopyrimidine glycosylase [Psittacicella gerlachiana]
MPELPEVETTVRGIEPLVVNQTISNIIINNDKCRVVPGKELLAQVNTTIKNAFRRAKYVCLDNGYGYIVIHLGMSGNLKVVDQSLPLLKHDHVQIQFSNGKELRYNDHRRFGGVTFIAYQDFGEHKLFAHNGPDALSDDFNGEYLASFIKKRPNRPIKLLLMDNSIVVGVGNIYANESLFECKINPCTFTGDLKQEQAFILVDSIKNILKRSIAAGGTTLKDFEQPDGKPGYFAQSLQCYGKEGEYDQEYDDYFIRIELGGRSSYVLPKRQPLIGKAVEKYSELIEEAKNKTDK